jgi:hypothetical protein
MVCSGQVISGWQMMLIAGVLFKVRMALLHVLKTYLVSNESSVLILGQAKVL